MPGAARQEKLSLVHAPLEIAQTTRRLLRDGDIELGDRATNRALSFSAIVLAATNPSEDMLMDMASASIGDRHGRRQVEL